MEAGKRTGLSFVPSAIGIMTPWRSQDANAAGRKVFLGLTALDLPVGGGKAVGTYYDWNVRGRDAMAERVKNSEKWRVP